MIEEIVLNYLSDKLDVPVFMEYPKKEYDKFVLVEKTGGSESNYINSATITIQSYADTLYNTAELNEIVKSRMNNIIELDSVSKSKLNNDYNYADTTRKRHRYQAVFDLVYF